MKVYSDNTVTRDYLNDVNARQNAEITRLWQVMCLLGGLQVVTIGLLVYYTFF